MHIAHTVLGALLMQRPHVYCSSSSCVYLCVCVCIQVEWRERVYVVKVYVECTRCERREGVYLYLSLFIHQLLSDGYRHTYMNTYTYVHLQTTYTSAKHMHVYS